MNIKNCHFCGSECMLYDKGLYFIYCTNRKCDAQSPMRENSILALEAHNHGYKEVRTPPDVARDEMEQSIMSACIRAADPENGFRPANAHDLAQEVLRLRGMMNG